MNIQKCLQHAENGPIPMQQPVKLCDMWSAPDPWIWHLWPIIQSGNSLLCPAILLQVSCLQVDFFFILFGQYIEGPISAIEERQKMGKRQPLGNFSAEGEGPGLSVFRGCKILWHNEQLKHATQSWMLPTYRTIYRTNYDDHTCRSSVACKIRYVLGCFFRSHQTFCHSQVIL